MAEAQVRRILLIDDDEDDFLLTRDMLGDSRRGRFILEWACNYEAGLRQLASRPPYDVVLVDYDLGDRNGIDLIRQAALRGCQSPIIMVTGRGSYEVDLEAMQAGADDYLSKNDLNSAVLERAIRYAVERHQSRQDLKQSRQEISEILESISDGFLALDPDWRMVYINKRASRNGGREPEEVTGKVIWDVWPYLVGTTLWEKYHQVMETRLPAHFEMENQGGSRWYDVSVYPFDRGISVYWIDKTDRKRSDLSREEILQQVDEARAAAEQAAEEASSAARSARASSTQLEAILNSLADAVLFFRPDGVVQMANSYAVAMFGFDPIRLSRSVVFQRLKASDPDGASIDPDQFPSARARQGEICLNFPMNLMNPRGREYWVIASSLPLFIGREFLGTVEVYKDITDLHRTENALREQKQELAIRNQQLQGLFDYGPVGLALFGAEFPYPVIMHNQVFERFWGITPGSDGLMGKSLHDFIAPAEQKRFLSLFNEVAQSKAGKTLYDFPYEGASGGHAWLNITLSPIFSEGALVAFAHMLVDVTDGYKARLLQEAEREEHERIALSKEVQRQLMIQRESERIQIARDLHDGPLQDLIGVSFSLVSVMNAVENQDNAIKLSQVQEILQKNIRDLRVFCNELRPPVLTPFGLERAIRSHAYTLKERYPSIEFHLDLMPDKNILPEETRIALFRIYQELISNVSRHADASQVWISLKVHPKIIYLEVKDDGAGFRLPENWTDLVRQGHLGLSGIRERVELAGGEMALSSSPGKGTQVKVSVPVNINKPEPPLTAQG